MKSSKILSVLLLVLICLPGKVYGQSQNYSGSYHVTTGDVTLTLTLKQDGSDAVTGTLLSSNGTRFSLEGMVSEGIAGGTCSGNEGSLYFEAYIDGNDLTLSLIQPDQFNIPDYDNARYMVMSRKSGQPAAPEAFISPQPSTEQRTASSPETGPSSTPDLQSPGTISGTEVVKDEVNGFSFTKPEGWVHQQGDGQIILGSNTIPGLISVFPHQASNYQELQGLMYKGFQEEGVYLALDGAIQQQGSNLSGYFNGSVQGEQARGYGIGILGQYGSGAFVMAVSTPQKLGQEIMTAADFLARNTQFSKPTAGDSDLVRHFTGEWAWTNGYRTEWMTFYPNGIYSDQSEASYSGNMSDGSGNITGNWGVAGQDSNKGRWSVQGNRDSGVITVTNPDGSQTRYEYRVFVERGEKYYREYLLNGYHYRKQKNF